MSETRSLDRLSQGSRYPCAIAATSSDGCSCKCLLSHHFLTFARPSACAIDFAWSFPHAPRERLFFDAATSREIEKEAMMNGGPPMRASRARQPIIDRLGTSCVAVLALLSIAAEAGAATPPYLSWTDYNAIAQQSLTIGPALNLNGNYAVVGAGGFLRMDGQSTQLPHNPPFVVVGDVVQFGNGLTV